MGTQQHTRGSNRRRAFAALAAALLTAATTLTIAAAPAQAATWEPTVVDGETQPVLDPGQANVEDVWITTPVDTDHDGQPDEVHAQLTIPDVATGGTKVPVVVEASPYYGGVRDAGVHDGHVELWDPSQPKPTPSFGTVFTGDDIPPLTVDGSYWMARGFAFAKVATIGTEESTGCPQMLGRDEATAMKAVVEWLTGASGSSARTQDGTPISAEDWSSGKVGMTGVSYDGSLPLLTATTGVAGLDAIAPMAPVSSFYDYYRYAGGVYAPGPGGQGSDLDNFVLGLRPAGDTTCLSTAEDFLVQEDRTTGDDNDFWEERNLLNYIDDVHTPTLIGQGMSDFNVRVDQSTNWYLALRDRGIPTKLYLHQGEHVDVANVPGSGWQDDLNRWFSQYLYDVPNDVQSGPTARIEREDDTWYDAPAWPDASAAPVDFFPTAGGSGTGGVDHIARAGAVETDDYVDDASESLQSLAEAASSGNRALYRTAPVQQELHLSGTPHAEVTLSFDRPAANVSLAITDETPDGVVRIITRAWIDPQNRTDDRTTEPVVPGTAYDLSLTFVPTDYRVPAGDSIGLMLASSDSDTSLLPGPGTVLTVDTSASSFELPVAGGAAAVVSALGAAADPTVNAAQASVDAGAAETVTGDGLAPDVPLTLVTGTGQTLQVQTDAAGAFTADLPTDGLPAGATTLTLMAGRAVLASTAFTVTTPTPAVVAASTTTTTLAATGMPGHALGLGTVGALALLAAGALLLAFGRIRRARRG
jgi:X-Pro dipeptidyl-peptidase